MFENYSDLSAEERAQVKALHVAIRSDREFGERYRNLAWGFIRGFKFRRIERSHRMQKLPDDAYMGGYGYSTRPEGKFFEHNMPTEVTLAKLLAKHLPEFEADFLTKWQLREGSRITTWLKDLEGAIPAPVREKRPYVAPASREVA